MSSRQQECFSCPANSVADEEGSVVCVCEEDHFRTPLDSPSAPCTRNDPPFLSPLTIRHFIHHQDPPRTDPSFTLHPFFCLPSFLSCSPCSLKSHFEGFLLFCAVCPSCLTLTLLPGRFIARLLLIHTLIFTYDRFSPVQYAQIVHTGCGTRP